jgi:hypothetical protein
MQKYILFVMQSSHISPDINMNLVQWYTTLVVVDVPRNAISLGGKLEKGLTPLVEIELTRMAVSLGL